MQAPPLVFTSLRMYNQEVIAGSAVPKAEGGREVVTKDDLSE
jgi:hypothetical protein